MANKTIADIVSDFDLRRARREHRLEILRQNNPELQNLEQEQRTLLLKKLEFAFLSSPEDEQALDAQIQSLETQKQELMRSQGLEMHYQCPICKDTGIVNGHYCACLLSDIYREIYDATDIESLSASFSKFDLSVFDQEQRNANGTTQRERMKLYQTVCQDYIANFPNTPKPNLLLRGKAGLGKSYLLDCMAVAAKKRRIDVCLLRAASLFNVFFSHRMGEEIPLSFLREADLLLIDDLGTEPITQNVSIEYLFDLLNRRLETQKHTIVATNITDLQKRYDERISSRLESNQACYRLEFDGKDLRLT